MEKTVASFDLHPHPSGEVTHLGREFLGQVLEPCQAERLAWEGEIA
ncbi:hypothetical protein [Alkalibaculum bacchi]|nr:hypothetical protein [Alkalibaculum bacchi]